jgi:hypothetical protein
VSTYGVKEGMLSAAAIGDIDTVDQLATQNLAITSTPDESILAKLDDVSATSGYSAYVDFGLGDSATAPTISGGTQTIRCASITITEDGNSYLDVITEWGTARDLAEERTERWLTVTENGTLDGRSPTPVVSVTSPSILESGTANVQTLTFATDGAYEPEIGDTSGPGKTPESKGFFYCVEASCNEAGTADTTFEILINGTPNSAVTLTNASTETIRFLPYTEVVMLEIGDIVTCEVTAAGGHAGIGVRVLYVEIFV